LVKQVGGGRGAEVEREDKGAEGGRLWVGTVPPPQKNFRFWLLIWWVLVHSALYFYKLHVLHGKRYNLVPFMIIFGYYFRFKNDLVQIKEN